MPNNNLSLDSLVGQVVLLCNKFEKIGIGIIENSPGLETELIYKISWREELGSSTAKYLILDKELIEISRIREGVSVPHSDCNFCIEIPSSYPHTEEVYSDPSERDKVLSILFQKGL